VKHRINKTFAAIAFTLLLLTVARTSAQEQKEQKKGHHHYKLVDIGTFGGPNSSFVGVPPSTRLLNNSGAAVGSADTPTPDPASCFNFDCFLSYGFKWQDGVVHKLSALPGFNSSFGGWVNDIGQVTGISENGIDPLTGAMATEAILWGKDGSLTDLGTLGGNVSAANAVNNLGEVAGEALNAIPDPYTSNFNNFFILGSTQVHAFRWTKSHGIQDLGTLGGTDSIALFINEHRQIAGWSFTDTRVNPTTGTPTQDPFLWENGRMLDLGTLGGTSGLVNALNNRGEVVGASNLAGDLTNHPFLWSKSAGMQDLGTLGGNFGAANYINDAGEIVGTATPAGDPFNRAFLRRNGVMTDLGTLGTDPDSEAFAVNLQSQVVGNTSIFGVADLRAFLWENGGPMVDLNTLIPPTPSLELTHGLYINDRGEIAAEGNFTNGDFHAFILIPCDENHPGLEGCDYDDVEAVADARGRSAQIAQSSAGASAARLSPAERITRFRSLMTGRNRRSGAAPTK
jgi:probable HAF family extracellular repeat protein